MATDEDKSKKKYHLIKVPEELIVTGKFKEFRRSDWMVYMTVKKFENNKSHKAWPGYRLISTLSGLSMTKIQPALSHLEKLGVIEILQKGRGKGNEYTFCESSLKSAPQNVEQSLKNQQRDASGRFCVRSAPRNRWESAPRNRIKTAPRNVEPNSLRNLLKELHPPAPQRGGPGGKTNSPQQLPDNIPSQLGKEEEIKDRSADIGNLVKPFTRSPLVGFDAKPRRERSQGASGEKEFEVLRESLKPPPGDPEDE